MKLVVESGATKSTWVLLRNGQTIDTQILEGINPTSNPASVGFVNTYEGDAENIKKIYFYGAGVSNSAAKGILTKALNNKFANSDLFLGHDILAAALSVSYGQSSIVSILGTGTNTVVFDGTKIVTQNKALGYLFGDYGSGFHLGKILIRKFFRNQMQEVDHLMFQTKYLDGQDDLLFRIYNAAKPNFVTAGLSYFLSECSIGLKKEVLEEAFSAFYVNQIEKLELEKPMKLNFVGSISAVFENELRQIGADRGFEIGKIVGNPINGLLDYHSKHIN